MFELTLNKMKKILKRQINFKSLKKDSGITEFLEFAGYSIGISYETGENGQDVYIFNIFDEKSNYINVKGNDLSNSTLKELVKEWNKVVNVKKILIDRIQENYNFLQIEDILGEQISSDIVENMDEHISQAFDELPILELGKVISDNTIFDEQYFLFFLAS